MRLIYIIFISCLYSQDIDINQDFGTIIIDDITYDKPFLGGFNKPKIFHIILGILLSVIIYYINFFSTVLGENGKISTTLSVWMPLLIIILISSIGLVRINEK